jgi:hypothetical protein
MSKLSKLEAELVSREAKDLIKAVRDLQGANGRLSPREKLSAVDVALYIAYRMERWATQRSIVY